MGGRPERPHPPGARCPSRPGWWHERLVALMQLPVVMAAQVRGEHLFCLERPAGAEQFVLTRRSAVDPDADAGRPRSTRPPAPPTRPTPIDWFDASPDGALVAVGTSEGGTEDSVLRVLDDRRRPRPRRGDPQHPGVQRGLGARRLGLRLHPLPGGRRVPPHGAPPPPRRRLARTIRWCGPSTPTRRRGRTSTMSPDGRWLLVHVLVGWARVDVHLLDRSDRRRGRRSIAGVEVDDRVRVRRRRRLARRRDDARRAAGPGRAGRRSTRPGPAAGRRSSPRATPCSVGSPVARRRAAASSPRTGPSTPSRRYARRRPLARRSVDGLGDVDRRRRASTADRDDRPRRSSSSTRSTRRRRSGASSRRPAAALVDAAPSTPPRCRR